MVNHLIHKAVLSLGALLIGFQLSFGSTEVTIHNSSLYDLDVKVTYGDQEISGFLDHQDSKSKTFTGALEASGFQLSGAIHIEKDKHIIQVDNVVIYTDELEDGKIPAKLTLAFNVEPILHEVKGKKSTSYILGCSFFES